LQKRLSLLAVSSPPAARTQIENVAAFVFTEKALVEGAIVGDLLETAKNHIQQMEKSLPEDEWIGRFFDTRGCWHYACTELLEKNPTEKLKLLYSAEQDLGRALRRDEDFPAGSNIRQDHLELVRKAISKLEPVGPVAEPSAPVGA
jgi:hypothetical protein